MDKCKDGGNRQRGYPLMLDMTEQVMAQCVSKKRQGLQNMLK